jgi:hypothetical protein
MKNILSGHALGSVVLQSQGRALSFTVRQLLVDITADHMIRKCGGRLVVTLDRLHEFSFNACGRHSYISSVLK